MGVESARIADQLERALGGEAWHGPALGELLAEIDSESAAAHSLPGAHSIWEIVDHLHCWHEVPRRRLAGETPEVGDEIDWPPVAEDGGVAWDAARERLGAAHRELVTAVRQLDDQSLDEPLASGSSARELLLGVLQHDAYHGGQIALLRRVGGAGGER